MKLYCFIICIACCMQLHAQPVESVPFKRFGFHLGANVSNMDFNKGEPAPPAPIAASWKAGLTLGFIMRVPLGEKWLLQPEYNYIQRNGADKSISTSYQLDYISLPVLLHYRITDFLSAYAGPQGELLIRASSTSNGVKLNITHDTEERSIAAVAGIELRVLQSFFLSARYINGFNHIGIGQRSAVKEFKYESVGITAGVSF